MSVTNIDHVAITTGDLDAFLRFYARVLGAVVEDAFEIDGRRSVVQLGVGGAMLNIHRQGHSYPLVAQRPTPGAIDICFRWNAPIGEAVDLLARKGVEIVEGPAGGRTCSDGVVGQSVYFNDCDGNLVELLSTVQATVQASR